MTTARVAPRRHLRLALTGDVMLGRLENEAIAREGPAYPWGDLLPTLHSADLRLINLECAITAAKREWHDGAYKAFYFRADPPAVATLQCANVDFACLANNHAGDFGHEGLLETVRLLDRAHIAHAGAGADAASAGAPARLERAGWKLAVVAFADYPTAWAASATTPGINYTPVSTDPADFALVQEAITCAREGSDLTIFTIHWGPNMRERPTGQFRAFARRVIEAGADIFWGHSAHVVQGVEVWHGRPIIYDAGDFVDDYAVDPILRNDLSALFLVDVGPTGVEELTLVPVAIDDMQVRLARGPDRAWFIERFARLCSGLGTTVADEHGQPVIRITRVSPAHAP